MLENKDLMAYVQQSVAVALKAQQRLRACWESDCQATAKASEHVRVKSWSTKGSKTMITRDCPKNMTLLSIFIQHVKRQFSLELTYQNEVILASHFGDYSNNRGTVIDSVGCPVCCRHIRFLVPVRKAHRTPSRLHGKITENPWILQWISHNFIFKALSDGHIHRISSWISNIPTPKAPTGKPSGT